MATLDELNVLLGADTSGLERGLARGTTSISSFTAGAVKAGATTQGAMQGVSQAAAAAAASMGGVSIAAQRAANGGLSDYDRAAGRFIDASGRMHEANGKFVKSSTLASEAAGNLGGSVGGAAQKMGVLVTANTALAVSFAAFDAEREKLEGGLGRFGEGMKTGGQNLSTYVTLPLAALGGLSGKAAVEFESAFAGVKKTLDTSGLSAEQTAAEYGRLSEGIRQLAQTIPATTTEIAGVAEAAGQLGIKRENVLDFTRVMIDLGNSTNLSADQAATSLARLANITGLPQSQFENLGSTIVALGNNFATTEAEITEMGLRIAGAGKQVGLTEADILGFSAALSSVGIAAEAGGTAFSTVLKQIQGAVENGGSALANFAKVAGVSAADFKKAFQTNAAGATVAFIEGLGRIKEEGGSTLQTLAALDLADIRVSDSLLRLSGAGDLARRSVALGTEAFAENTALAKEAGQRYETTASQIQVAKNRLNDLGITIGNQLLPVIKGMSSLLGGTSDALNNMSPAAAKAVLVVGGLVASIGPLALGIGTVVSVLPTAVAGFTALGTAITFATGPIGLIVAGTAALAGGIYYLSQANERAKTSFEQQAKSTATLNSSISPLLDRYDQLTSKTKLNAQEQEELASIIKKVESAVPGMVNKLDQYGNAIGISTDKTRKFIQAQQELEKAKAGSAISGAKSDLAKYGAELEMLQRKVAEFNKTGLVSQQVGSTGISRQVKLTAEEVSSLKEKLAEANLKYIEQEQYVARLNTTLGILPRTFQSIYTEQQNLEKALTSPFLKGLDAASQFNKAAAGGKVSVAVTPVVEPETLAKLREQLKAATERRDNAGLGTKEFTDAQAEMKRLQALIDKYEDAGKAAKKAATDIEKAFTDVRKKLSGVDTQVKLGITAEGTEATIQKIKILEDGLKRLSDLGVSSANTALQKLNTQLLTLQQSLTKGVEPIAFSVVPEVKVDRTIGDKLGKSIASIIGPELANRPLTLPLSLPTTYVDEAGAILNANIAIAKGLREVNAASLTFGAGFDTAAGKANVLANELRNLLAAGVDPLNPAVQALSQQLQGLSEQQSLISAFRAGVQNALSGIGDSIGEALGAIVTGTATLDQGLQFVFGNIISAIGDFMGTLGQQLIALGVAKLGLDNLFASGPAGGPAAIAAGIGLIALSGVTKAIGKKAAGSLGKITGTGGGGGVGPSNNTGTPYRPPSSNATRMEPVVQNNSQTIVLQLDGREVARSLMITQDKYTRTTGSGR